MSDSNVEVSTAPGNAPESKQPKPWQKQFSWKHMVSLSLAIGLSLLIYLYHDEIGDLRHYAYGGAFLAMLIGNATLILPVPGLIIVYLLGSTLNPLLLGLVAGPGAALGEMTGYFAGYGGSALIDNTKAYDTVRRWMKKYGLAVITIMAAIPNPFFDIAGIVAGSLRLKWWRFFLAALIGKTLQAIFIAYAGALSIGWVRGLLS